MTFNSEQLFLLNQLYDMRAYLFSVNMEDEAYYITQVITNLEEYFRKEQKGEN